MYSTVLNRPLVIFGAAFLTTVAAALFSPLLMLFIALPAAFGLLLFRGKPRTAALIISLGCLTAIIASGLFLSRLEGSRLLIDTVQRVNGTIFYSGDKQMATVTLPNGHRRVTSLFPPADGLETGDSFEGSIKIKKVETDRWQHLLSGSILLEASPEELTYLNGKKPPLAIGGMLLRQRLTHELRTLSPIPATDITAAILFSLKDHLPPDLRTAFSKSGMSHLMAVSGLHLSILVWTLVAGVKRLGGGKALQALCGSAAALLMFFTAGMTPSVFRAAIMILLTLFAELLSRKSDGLTSLSVAAVSLVAVSPPVLTDLSFLLSFFSVGGILLLSPRFFTVAEQFWVSRFAVCGKAAKWVLSALSVSAAAQLATAPIVAFSFGSLPLLGILINLVAIPLVYPVLVFGFAACLLLSLSHGLAALLLLPANLCSALLGIIARFSAELPFCTLQTLFPIDFLPLLFLVAGAACAVIFTHRVRLLHRALGVCLSCALGSAVLAAFISYNSIIIASSAVTGSLIIFHPQGAVLVEHTKSEYHRALDSRTLARLDSEPPSVLVAPYPYDTETRLAKLSDHYGNARIYTPASLSSPIQPLGNLQISIPEPYVTEIIIGNTKLMKFYAAYDTIDTPKTEGDDVLLADRQGNLLSLGGHRHIFRRKNGDSLTRIYMN